MKVIYMIFRTPKHTPRHRRQDRLILPQPYCRPTNEHGLRTHCVPSTMLSTVVREEKCKSLLVREGAGAREKVTELQYHMGKVTAHKAQRTVKSHGFQPDEVKEVLLDGVASY